MQSTNRKRILIVAGIFILLIVMTLFLISRSSKTSKNTYVDPLSHQTVTNIPGKTPEKAGSRTDFPSLLGFDTLIDYGLTYNQLNELNQAFYNYSKSLPVPIQEISIDVDHITEQHDSNASHSPFVIQFKVRLDREADYRAKIVYYGINDMRLYLLNPTNGSVIYDSHTFRPEGTGG